MKDVGVMEKGRRNRCAGLEKLQTDKRKVMRGENREMRTDMCTVSCNYLMTIL